MCRNQRLYSLTTCVVVRSEYCFLVPHTHLKGNQTTFIVVSNTWHVFFLSSSVTQVKYLVVCKPHSEKVTVRLNHTNLNITYLTSWIIKTFPQRRIIFNFETVVVVCLKSVFVQRYITWNKMRPYSGRKV